jgi:hypothetical protein
LRELLPSGLSVALVRETGICYAKIDTAFPNEHKGPGKTPVRTALAGSENCWGALDKLLRRDIVLAVMGVDRGVVRVIPPGNDESPLPKHIELKALVLLPATSNPCGTDRMLGGQIIFDVRPLKVLRVGDSAIRIFDTRGGPMVLLRNNDVSRLNGNYTFGGHVFFSVNEKLYLTYKGYDCLNCSTTHMTRYVYDLSGDTPKIVYDGRLWP